jgi:streptogramin lyase
MTCCGRKKTQASETTGTASAAARRSRAGLAYPAGSSPKRLASGALGATWFEYFGAGALTVIGAVTQRSYKFTGYGSRIAVDPRDRLSLRAVPHLRESR